MLTDARGRSDCTIDRAKIQIATYVAREGSYTLENRYENLNLYLLRHGEAGNRTAIPVKDAERSLTVAGRRELEEIATSMLSQGMRFDRILASPLKRAYETAAIVSKTFKTPSLLEQWNELRPEASRPDLYRRLSKLKQDSEILIVGHEPYLGTIIGEMVSGNGNSHISIKKGGLAKIRVTSFVPKASGELRWLLTPKQIRKLS
jgi:phosphohistidine phosphatase